MANFRFKVLSHRWCNKKNFCVAVSTDDKIYIQLKNKSVADVNLKNNQFLIIKFENSDEKHGYLNWDNNDPKDKKRKSRNHLEDIDDSLIEDFNSSCQFDLERTINDILSWKFTCKQYGMGDETVNVTFGEDQPDELPHNK